MKDYFAAIALFALALFLLGKVALSQVQKVSLVRQQVVTAQDLVNAAQQRANTKSLMMKGKVGTDNVGEYLRRNESALQVMREIGSINDKISSESRALNVPIQEQRTAARELPPSAGVAGVKPPPAHEYTVSILTQFRDSLAWLGRIQDSFPFSRIEKIEINPSGAFVTFKVVIVFPAFDTKILAQNP